jgi:hypothetical protein
MPDGTLPVRPDERGLLTVMYTITTSPGGHSGTAETVPRALAALVNQLTIGLPDGPVTRSITDLNGDEHRGHQYLNARLDLLQEADDQLADERYTQLHRAPMATGCPRSGSVDRQERLHA